MAYFPRGEGFVLHTEECGPVIRRLNNTNAFAQNVERASDDDREETHTMAEVRSMVADAVERHRPSGNFGDMDSYRIFGRPDTGITLARFLLAN